MGCVKVMVRALIKHAFATHAAHWSNAQKRGRMTKCDTDQQLTLLPPCGIIRPGVNLSK